MAVRTTPADWRLYVITDAAIAGGRSHPEVVRAALAGGADVIQLRDKAASTRALYEAACEIRRLTAERGAAFIVNDRLDLALAVDADGLHVGQDDLPAAAARRLLGPGKILGVSAASVEEVRTAERDGADYLGVGAIFEARETKPDAGAPRGVELLRRLSRHASVPLVAIGGITADNVGEVITAGAGCAAVISAVVGAVDITGAARLVRERITEAAREVSGRFGPTS